MSNASQDGVEASLVKLGHVYNALLDRKVRCLIKASRIRLIWHWAGWLQLRIYHQVHPRRIDKFGSATRSINCAERDATRVVSDVPLCRCLKR